MTYLFFQKILSLIYETSLKKFIQKSLNFTVPRLVDACNEKALREISKQLGVVPEEIVINNLSRIFCCLLMNPDRDSIGKRLKFLQASSRVKSVVDLVKTCALNLIQKLAFRLGKTKQEKAQMVRSPFFRTFDLFLRGEGHSFFVLIRA